MIFFSVVFALKCFPSIFLFQTLDMEENVPSRFQLHSRVHKRSVFALAADLCPWHNGLNRSNNKAETSCSWSRLCLGWFIAANPDLYLPVCTSFQDTECVLTHICFAIYLPFKPKVPFVIHNRATFFTKVHWGLHWCIHLENFFLAVRCVVGSNTQSEREPRECLTTGMCPEEAGYRPTKWSSSVSMSM